ncbi:hypothetical protein RBH26_05530 [Natronolimnohabitans sp. A-GB9]|uniref:hypothetical protein n=1 Tax=Natronolimnohabitans sp. A-GB9 TaxID=3069757 RepID=UPI0027B569FE|nr:hypothetical protein [Natronolimnohabitans sp. A-GB9]MDQ2049940.1 hypothetical protein [Natronolimnohabitans sp. A-GB9]
MNSPNTRVTTAGDADEDERDEGATGDDVRRLEGVRDTVGQHDSTIGRATAAVPRVTAAISRPTSH